MSAVSKKLHRQILLAARELVGAAGGTCQIETAPRGHSKLVILIGTARRLTPLSNSPRADEGDALKKKLADIRRILREIAEAT